MMSECCTLNNNKLSLKEDAICPLNGKRYKQVKRKTLLHHLSHPWDRTIKEQTYYYCDDPECDVIYFGEDATIFRSIDMRLDSQTRNNTVCYCFDISIDDYQNKKEHCKAFVIEQTKQTTCDCEIRNPSGKCCLKYFQ